jgi:signal transduction histidine kinase
VFISTVSHELRTPLTSIKGSLELLGQDPGGNEARRARLLDIAARNSDRLLTLVNELLDLQRVESGELALNFAEVSLAEIAQEALASTRGVAQRAEVTCRVAPSSLESDVRVRADAQRVQQVLINLVGNAIKFSGPGQAVTLQWTADESAARVEVVDEGVGIAPGFLERVFERFAQADGSTTRHYEGSGLGLAICKALVEGHGGEIGVRSVVGEGSTFFFTLPRQRPEPADSASA